VELFKFLRVVWRLQVAASGALSPADRGWSCCPAAAREPLSKGGIAARVAGELARRKHNLVVMGVSRRPGEKLFFGDTAAALLEKSERSLLFVAS
jgi:hypothetical protein